MICGIGTDLCELRRIAASLARRGERFAHKVLADGELLTWRERSARCPDRGLRYLGTRFAAKEAFAKAIGSGLRPPMRWRDCEVASLPTGQPVFVLHGALGQWFASQGLRAHLSLSDQGDYAASFCVVETIPIAVRP